jgi:hypothetical protein
LRKAQHDAASVILRADNDATRARRGVGYSVDDDDNDVGHDGHDGHDDDAHDDYHRNGTRLPDSAVNSPWRRRGRHELDSKHGSHAPTNAHNAAVDGGAAGKRGEVQELYARVQVTIARKDAIIEQLKEKYRASQEKVRSLEQR